MDQENKQNQVQDQNNQNQGQQQQQQGKLSLEEQLANQRLSLQKIKEIDREQRRLDSLGEKEHWAKQELGQKKKKNGARKRKIDQETRQLIRQQKKEKKKLKKQIEKQAKKLEQNSNQTNEEGQNKEQKKEFYERNFDKKKQKELYIQKMQDAPRVVVDFQFVDQTMERDRASLMKQIEVCHCMNQKYEKPLKLTTSQSEHPLMKQYVEQRNLNKWGIDLEKKDILDAYPKEQIIYLSGDVDIDMDVYEPEKIYIIGGLVEHNRLTNLTKNYAEKNGITARRLPLSRYLDLKACSLLNINHVFQILLMLHNGASMQKAIVSSVPQRKIGQVYFDTSSDESDNEKEKKEQ